MAGKSPVTASEEQRVALETLAASKDRGEADRARAILLTLKGWTSARIGEVFCVPARPSACMACTDILKLALYALDIALNKAGP